MVSNAEYDALLRRLKELEAEQTDFVTPNSPTQRVSGQVVEGFDRYTHKRPMMSLNNIYNIDELGGTAWNHVRTAASLAAAASFSIALGY